MIPEGKPELRRRLLAQRAACSPEHRAERDAAVCRSLLPLLGAEKPDGLLVYAAVRGEIDLTTVVREALARGIPVAYPRSEPGGRMTFHRVASPSELVPGRFSVPEPPPGAPELSVTSRTICLVPGLAFDREGYRLGYGGGYYDRFLTGVPVRTIGISEEACLLDRLPRDGYDIRVDRLVHESGVFSTQSNGAKP